ncbi:MAG: DMT family transporter [Bacteroidia bacterium]
MSKKSLWLLVHLSMIGVSLIYGGNYTVAKEVMPAFIQPSGFIMVRVWVALLMLTLIQIIFVKEKIRGLKDYAYLAMCAFFGVAANMLMFFNGLNHTTPINASLIMTLTPVIVLTAGTLLKEEQFRWRKLAGVLLGLSGAALLIAGPSLSFDTSTWWGDLLILFNASSYAIYLVLIRPMMVKYHPFTVIRWTFTFGALMVLPFGLNQVLDAKWTQMEPIHWAQIAFVVLGTTFIAYLLNAWALKFVKSSVVGSYIYLQPVFATLIAVVFADYNLYPRHLLYAALIMGGVFLVSWNKNNRQSVRSP